VRGVTAAAKVKTRAAGPARKGSSLRRSAFGLRRPAPRQGGRVRVGVRILSAVPSAGGPVPAFRRLRGKSDYDKDNNADKRRDDKGNDTSNVERFEEAALFCLHDNLRLRGLRLGACALGVVEYFAAVFTLDGDGKDLFAAEWACLCCLGGCRRRFAPTDGTFACRIAAFDSASLTFHSVLPPSSNNLTPL
jgi:hypothetical protein